MLSKFSNLPGLNFVSQNSKKVKYPQKMIEKAISEIKTLGKTPINGEDSLKEIRKILNHMKSFPKSVQIQRVSCHALSNLAMQVVAARWIIQNGGFNLIKLALNHFSYDHKLCWLASSAVWNLARPPANRGVIGKEGAKLMLKVLSDHSDKEKVTNTAIGALSNLSLLEDIKRFVSQKENLKVVVSVMKEYLVCESISVMTSAAGLIANIAVSDEYAGLLIELRVLPLLLKLLLWDHTEEETLFRNSCAALNNLVTAANFLDHFLLSRGIEIIYQFLELNTDNQMYFNLLENCLVNLDSDPNKKTTSFHLAAYHKKIDIIKYLIKAFPHFNLNAKDQNGMTLLDYAIINNNSQNDNGDHSNSDSSGAAAKVNRETHKVMDEMIQLLSKCGANKYSNRGAAAGRNRHASSNNNTNAFDQKMITHSIEKGQRTLKKCKVINQKCLETTLPQFPEDLCQFMVSFHSNVDLLEGLEQF